MSGRNTVGLGEVVAGLPASEEPLRAIFDRSPVGLAQLSLEGRWTLANQCLCDLFGLSQRNLLQRTLEDTTLPDDRSASMTLVRELLAGERKTGALEQRCQRPDGSMVWIHLRLSLVQSRTGAPRYFVGVVQEISDRKRAEAERDQLYETERHARAEAQAAVQLRDRYLSIAAHELRTPITSLRGFAQLAVRQLGRQGAVSPELSRHTLEVLDAQSGKLSRLISQLFDASSVDPEHLKLNRTPTDLTRLVNDLVSAGQVGTDRHAIAVRAPDSVIAFVDPRRLEQVLSNLLDNAIKHGDKGSIEVDLTTVLDGHAVEIAVRDHGPGIPEEQLPWIFDRYHQAQLGTRAHGLRLGLHLSRQLVERHGGELRAELPPDGGTRFVVHLPVSPSS